MAEIAHPFSPIISPDRLRTAVEYLAAQSLALARAVLERDLPLDTLCFFAQSDKEYAFLEQAVRTRGPISPFSHGPTLYADTDFMVHDQHIRIFGVRRPDPTRPQVGYGDYPVADYQALLALVRNNAYATEITSGLGKSLLELRHPQFDVLGFVVDERDHITKRGGDSARGTQSGD